ncbi:MAG: 2-C-methyl-D-erythritol 4-phosphate cytidylyltransferase [Cellulosilyticum sp.]|nr:2-C-methyl-D-erythritol 4-phosphate cytidylyltransferase [Cellulosilyticum sp.]
MTKIAAIIVAGGSGKRMGTAIKKQFIKLQDKEVLAHTIEAFNALEEISEVIVVTGEEDIHKVQTEIVEAYHFNKVSKVVAGGKERQDSVYNGLMATSEEIEYVMIHDGARPFISKELLKRAIEKTIECKATIIAVPVKDTIKVVEPKVGIVERTPEREKLWAVQTPQSFEKKLLIEAYEDAQQKGLQVTDDSMIVEAYGNRVHVVLGDYTNIKITTPEDLVIGESILSNKQ